MNPYIYSNVREGKHTVISKEESPKGTHFVLSYKPGRWGKVWYGKKGEPFAITDTLKTAKRIFNRTERIYEKQEKLKRVM